MGLIAGNGVLPRLFAEEAARRGLEVVAVCHRGETDPALEQVVARAHWVRVGQLNAVVRALKAGGATRTVMAGGIGRVRALASVRVDLGGLRVLSRLRTFRDDALLRGIAQYLEEAGVQVVAPTSFLERLLAPVGVIAGGMPSPQQGQDIALGIEVASLLGRADVGQTVVVRNGQVLAVEAVDGTDETIRRGGRLGGPHTVVVKRAKPGQDERFDLPAIGPRTIEVMREVDASVLAVEAGKSVLLDLDTLVRAANDAKILIVGVASSPSPVG